MNRSTLTPDLLHRLVVSSHTERITHLAVAAVIEHDDRVLLIEADADELDCCWEPPTDLVLPGETLTDAVHRVAAQAGLDIDHITSYLGYHDILTDNGGDIVRVFGFAATTMDTGIRLQRYIIEELGAQYGVPALRNGLVATVIAVAAVGALALGVDRGAGGMRIWPLFGTTNQLTAGLTLLVITIFLLAKGRKAWFTGVPMVFLLFMTTWAMIDQLRGTFDSEWLLFVMGAAVFALEIWVIVEAWVALRAVLGRRAPPDASEPEQVHYDATGTR